MQRDYRSEIEDKNETGLCGIQRCWKGGSNENELIKHRESEESDRKTGKGIYRKLRQLRNMRRHTICKRNKGERRDNNVWLIHRYCRLLVWNCDEACVSGQWYLDETAKRWTKTIT